MTGNYWVKGNLSHCWLLITDVLPTLTAKKGKMRKKIAEEIFSLLGKMFCRFRKVAEYYIIGKFLILQVLAQLYFPFYPMLFCVLLSSPTWLINKSTTIFHDRNDVKMFETRVKPLACNSSYTAYTAKFWTFWCHFYGQ